MDVLASTDQMSRLASVGGGQGEGEGNTAIQSSGLPGIVADGNHLAASLVTGGGTVNMAKEIKASDFVLFLLLMPVLQYYTIGG